MTDQLSATRAGTVRIGDLTVNRLGLGTNRLTDVPSARALAQRAVDLGINLIDTADFYQSGASEATLGATFSPLPTGLVVATKGGMIPGGLNGHPDYLRGAVTRSLERLRTDQITLYQLHRVDPEVPIEESVGALRELQETGKIRHLGLSNVTVEELERARRVAPIVSVQNQYSIAERSDDPVVDYCTEHGIAFLPWCPLMRGKLNTRPALATMAAEYGVTPPQLALSWLLRRSPVVLPIPGTLDASHLEQNVAAATIDLRTDDFRRLTE